MFDFNDRNSLSYNLTLTEDIEFCLNNENIVKIPSRAMGYVLIENLKTNYQRTSYMHILPFHTVDKICLEFFGEYFDVDNKDKIREINDGNIQYIKFNFINNKSLQIDFKDLEKENILKYISKNNNLYLCFNKDLKPTFNDLLKEVTDAIDSDNFNEVKYGYLKANNGY